MLSKLSIYSYTSLIDLCTAINNSVKNILIVLQFKSEEKRLRFNSTGTRPANNSDPECPLGKPGC